MNLNVHTLEQVRAATGRNTYEQAASRMVSVRLKENYILESKHLIFYFDG